VSHSGRPPLRGEIWFVKLATDPPEKGERPVVIVSVDQRNRHEKANTVLVVPLTTSTHKDVPTHVYLSPGETGLEQSCVRAEDVSVVKKASLSEPRQRLRTLSHARVCEVARAVSIAMGCGTHWQEPQP
jgi:mRNA-degrading endonuclease toxin of MazEF toxin-antitoxin module